MSEKKSLVIVVHGIGDQQQGATLGDFVAVSVQDTGTGIPPEFRSRVFEPFFQQKT